MSRLEIRFLPHYARYCPGRNDVGGFHRRLHGRVCPTSKWLESAVSTPTTNWYCPSFLGLKEGVAQLPATILILHELRQSQLFAMQGWRVGASWVLATASYSVAFFAAVVVG